MSTSFAVLPVVPSAAMTARRGRLLRTVISSALIAQANAAAFQEGSIIALRAVNGMATALASSAVVLDEFPSGQTNPAKIQTISIPSSGATPFSIEGDTPWEGRLSLGLDGSTVTIGGYSAAAGVASIMTTTARRALAVVYTSGVIGAPILMPAGAFAADNIHSAAIIDYSGNFYVAGACELKVDAIRPHFTWGYTCASPPTPVAASPYTAYVPASGAPATQIISSNTRKALVYQGTLYLSIPAGGVYRVGTVGSPPTTASSKTLITGSNAVYTLISSNAYSFVFQSSLLLWVCDGGTLKGVFLLTWSSGSSLYVPTVRAWSADACYDSE